MKTISINIYSFAELSEEAKENTIENVRQTYYESNDFAMWAIDDCSLFEPKHEELTNLLGEDYKFPLLKNTRNKIYFDTDRGSYLDCENALIVTNDIHFFKWLGLSEENYNSEDFQYSIFTPKGRDNTTILEFSGYSEEFESEIENAVEKFSNLMDEVLKRIENDIDYRFTDEAIEEDIEANEYEFTIDGEIY